MFEMRRVEHHIILKVVRCQRKKPGNTTSSLPNEDKFLVKKIEELLDRYSSTKTVLDNLSRRFVKTVSRRNFRAATYISRELSSNPGKWENSKPIMSSSSCKLRMIFWITLWRNVQIDTAPYVVPIDLFMCLGICIWERRLLSKRLELLICTKAYLECLE